MEAAFRRSLESALAMPVDFHVEYLELLDGGSAAYEQRVLDLFHEKYARRRIDLIFAVRAETLDFVVRHRDQLFSGVPVVFADVRPGDLGSAPVPPDVTGVVLQPLQRHRTLSSALELQPGAKRVVLVGGASALDREVEPVLREQIRARAPHLELISLIGQPLEDQLRQLSELSRDSIVLFTSYRADSTGRSRIAANMLRRVTEASRAPVYGAVPNWLGLGIVGGDLIQYEGIGARAAELANRVLRGEAASSIAPVEAPPPRLTFDWRQIQRWGMDERRIPAGSEILFRTPTLFEAYRWYVLGALGMTLLQTLLIGALLLERNRRRRTTDRLREADQAYRILADFNSDWEFWKKPDGSYAYVSPSVSRVTGYDARAFYERPTRSAELIVPEDRQRWDDHDRIAMQGGGPAALDFRIATVSGQVRWIEHRCTPVVEEGRFLGLRGSNRDITARKQHEAELRQALAEIQQLREQLEVDNTYLHEELTRWSGVDGIVGASDPLRYVLGRAKQVAETSSTVLLLGETGVGKDMIAAAIHSMSARRARPLVRVNCAALPPTLIETELFGHEKGAFTGADAQRKGRFEIANGTTLFLDEVGELPLELQGKLLRVLQDGEFERVGGNVTIKTDARIIAATNRNLREAVKAGGFREDLWYRLNVFPITVPSLRQRREDIPLLVRHFVEKHCRRAGRPRLDVSKATMKNLEAREWVGNVRELESVIERAVITSKGTRLQLADETEPSGSGETVAATSAGAIKTLADAERDHIVTTLDAMGWQLAGEGGAAARLGINPSTLRSRMQRLGIRRPTLRSL
jgi:PAS domain S-box-containing protein